MYVMPLEILPNGKQRVFFEETSLVGVNKRILSFQECKKRAIQRLLYHNITIYGLEEEEYCYIPMGGELPSLKQRMIGFGGAANMVHPSTGYQACRMIASSINISNIIQNDILQKKLPDEIASNVYANIWSQQNRKQRDFQVFFLAFYSILLNFIYF